MDRLLKMFSTIWARENKTECMNEFKVEELTACRRPIWVSSSNGMQQCPGSPSQLRFLFRVKLVNRFD